MKPEVKWFANRGQIIQIVLGAIGCLLAGVKVWPEIKAGLSGVSAPVPIIFVIIAVNTVRTAYSVVRQNKERERFVVLAVHLQQLRNLTDDYLEMVRRWPNSVAVQNPFSLVWRPSIGETQFGEDVRRTMDWVEKFRHFAVFATDNRLISWGVGNEGNFLLDPAQVHGTPLVLIALRRLEDPPTKQLIAGATRSSA